MSYLDFLLQWYNWPYLAGLLFAAVSLVRPSLLKGPGSAAADWLGYERLSGVAFVRAFGLAVGVIGLTVSGALHDYWPRWQERGFLPGLGLTVLLGLLVTRSLNRFLQRNFPEIKAVSWGASELAGREGRVVSRMVSPDYRAGRAQVMGDDETLHMVLCKTREGEISYGALVVLMEYDADDGRYVVERVEGEDAEEGVDLRPGGELS